MPGTPSARRERLDQLRAKIDETLFPQPDPPTHRLSPGKAGALTAGLLALGVVLAMLRLGRLASLNTVWAEDGPVYLQEAFNDSFFGAIFTPYAGYLVLVPRLIAEVATLAPLEHAAAAVSLVSALVAVLSGLAVWCGCSGHVRNLYLRGGLVLATVLAASAGQETLLSAAYAPWYMLVGSFWLLFWRPQTTWGAALGGLFLLATGLSTPGVWFFMPVALLRAAAARNEKDAILVGSFFLGGVIQLSVMLGQEQGESLWTSHIWTAYLQRVVDGGLLGQRLGGNLWEELGWNFLGPFVVVVAWGLALGIWRAAPGPRWFAVIAVLGSAAIFIVSVYQREVGLNVFWSEGSSGGTSSRYVFVPALLLISAIVVLVDGALRRRARTAFSWPVAAASAVIVLAVVTSFDMRGGGFRESPYWEDALRRAADECQATGEVAGIPTSPEPFGVQISCEEIESFANATQTNPARAASASSAATGE
jgi:hypothetical protein